MPDARMLFVLLLALPLAGALIAGARRGRVGDLAALAGATGAALVAGILAVRHGISGVTVAFGGLPALDRLVGHPVTLFGFTLDPLASLVLLGATLIGAVCVLYSIDYVGPANRETPVTADRRGYWFWLLTFVTAMAGLVTSATLVQMFLFWELTTVCSWALIGFYENDPHALDAARKAFLMTAGGGLALFATILALLALTHTAGFDGWARLPAGARGAATALALLLLAGAWAKSGQVPFHTWLPSAMAAPSPVSAYLHAASMVNAGVYLVLRITLANATPSPQVAMTGDPAMVLGGLRVGITALPAVLAPVVGVMAVITLVVAVTQFFFQDDLKRLLAYSTVSHLALILLGVALAMSGSQRAAQGAALHILAHGVGKALLFLSVGTLSYTAGTRHIRDLSGVITRAPVAAMGFLIGLLTVTGVPPFAGFWSKLLMLTGAVSLGGWGVAAGALIVAESLVAFAWFLWVGQRVFLGAPSAAVVALARPSRTMDAALVILMAMCVLVAVVGMPLATALRLGGAGG